MVCLWNTFPVQQFLTCFLSILFVAYFHTDFSSSSLAYLCVSYEGSSFSLLRTMEVFAMCWKSTNKYLVKNYFYMHIFYIKTRIPYAMKKFTVWTSCTLVCKKTATLILKLISGRIEEKKENYHWPNVKKQHKNDKNNNNNNKVIILECDTPSRDKVPKPKYHANPNTQRNHFYLLFIP